MAFRLQSIDQEALTTFAQELVRTPSPSTQEGEVASLTAAEMRSVGFDDVTIDRMGNVIGRIGPDTGGKKLLYDAHMDTVGVGEISNWQRDPFAGDIADGILYGRGACDMKGALAAMVYAAKALIESSPPLTGDLYVVGVVQEETCEGLALQHIVEEKGLRPDWVLLGEPTNLQIARGQRGRMGLQIKVRGRSCHASTPERGTNAIYEAARIVVGLELLAPQLERDPFLGQGTIAVTDINSTKGSDTLRDDHSAPRQSVQHNTIPDNCTLYIDRRLTTGETETRAINEVRRIIAREGVRAEVEIPVYDAKSYKGYRTEKRQFFSAWTISEADPFLLQASETVDAVLGFVPHTGKWNFSTDGVYSAGTAGIPTVGFGPGEEAHAHTVDDQVRLDDLKAAAQVYAQLAARMLR
ncbi:MAG: YgeY family selenium metabolism-linked hydrolase [Anaerolineales bacterium]